MEKALEILKEILDMQDMSYKVENKVCEAILELEEAMKPKSCEGCEYLDGCICRHDRGLYCVRQFEADYFKPKDTQC